METLDILKIAVKAADDKKGEDIEVIKVDDLTILADYFMIVSGASNTQVRAIAEEIEDKLAKQGVEPHHIEGRASTWILIDYGTVVVHVFYKEAREFYDLSKLWQEGEQVDVEALLEGI